MYIIYNSPMQVGDTYGPSLNAALLELNYSSGIIPIISKPYGGERTPAEEEALGGPYNSDHVKKRAIDLYNQRQFRNWNNDLFEEIMHKHGWYCVNVDGEDFTEDEPWHFANRSLTPESINVVPLNERENKMETSFCQMIAANGTDINDWSRIGADILPTVNNPLGGYEATNDINIARIWDKQYTGGKGPTKMVRATYIAQQQFGVKERANHQADKIATIKEAMK